MTLGSGELALGRYRLGEKCDEWPDGAIFAAVDPRRPGLGVRLVVVPEHRKEQAGLVVGQTRCYALGTAGLATAAAVGEIVLWEQERPPAGERRGLALAFELGTGRTLDRWADANGLEPRRILRIIENAARLLAVLHDQGLAHGFLRRSLLAVGTNDEVVLGGYGVAQLVRPEPPDPRVDGVALGALARELLVSVPPVLLAECPEVARWLDAATHGNSEFWPKDIVRWAEGLGAAVHEQLSKSASAPAASLVSAPAAPLVSAPAPFSPPPGALPLSPERRGEGIRPGLIAVALSLAVLLPGGVVFGLFAYTLHQAPAASSAAAPAAPAIGSSGTPPANRKPPAVPAEPPEHPAEPRPGDSEPHVRRPPAGAPDRGATPRTSRANPALAASDAEAALPVDPMLPAKAAPDALVTLLMFGDLECRHTRSAYRTLAELERLFPGELRIVWRHRPLREHGHAREAAAFAAALHGEQGASAFWRLLGDVSLSDDPADREWLRRWADRQERAFRGFQPPSSSAAAAARVDEDLALANRFAVRETPTLFINGLRVTGDRSLDELRSLVARELLEARGLVGAGIDPSLVYTTRVTKNLIGIGPELLDRACPPLAKSPRRGASRALATVVVFSDFQCPFCRRIQPTLERLLAKYNGEIAIVWKNLPLAQHPNATSAARLALAARASGGDSRFWRVHDLLFRADPGLETRALEGVAERAGLDPVSLMEAVRRGDHQAELDADIALARRLGVTGTPTAFVNGRRVGGAQSFSSFESLIREELRAAGRLIEHGVKRENLYLALCGEPQDR